MTIEKGKDWGSQMELPTDSPVVSTDRELAQHFTVSGDGVLVGPKIVGLCGPLPTNGDLARTVSARGSETELRSGQRTALPIDLAVVTFDGRTQVVSGSIVIRRPWWMGVVEGAMNASFLGEWNVTPAGHPNDGRFDVVRAELSTSDRFKAKKRLLSGTHIPHPDITIRRLRSGEFTPDSRASLWLDHHDFGHVDHVKFVVHPDATTIII